MPTHPTPHKESLKVLLLSQLEQAVASRAQFLFSPAKAGTLDLQCLQKRFEEEWAFLENHPGPQNWNLLRELLLPPEPYDLRIIEKLGVLESIFPAQDSLIIADLCLAKILG